MEFWGVEVKAGQSLKCNPGEEKYIHLSQAAIGEIKKDKGCQSIHLFVNFEGKKLVIGTLSSESCHQISYDLVFEKEFELSHNWKEGSVYFTGYKTVVAEEELEGYSDGDSESEDIEAIPLDDKANGKTVVKVEKTVAAAKQKAEPSKAKTKPANPLKVDSEDDDDDDDEDGSEDGESDEEMVEGEDDSESDEDEDDSSEEDVKVTPKKVESGKKRASASASDSKSPAPEKKAKLVTPAGKTGSKDGKKGGHTATPHPNKQASKTTVKPQTPKSAGSVSCKSCTKTFNSDGAMQSHTKAKHTK